MPMFHVLPIISASSDRTEIYQLFGFSWYQRPSLWIGIGTLHFGLVSAPFTLNWYRRDPSRIGETLSHKSVRPFTLDRYRRDPSSVSWDLWKQNFRYRLRPLNRSMASWCFLN
ncbi:hypothetical protein RhiirA1_542597 [Rhizophagus irregularis]|uniref:Uncharacterized protein n=1 Tax=Rhizophagus irregularis TaxID=588596 RepID=A0A2N0QW17_9GLOM|nr:hypothetical protein RhiirA1_542597 [Rhizophagus irregularis]